MTYRLLALAEQLDAATLRQVFTHTSWAAERVESYERLEFLGDSVLSLCVTTELYRRFPGFAEGHLARLRAYIVSRATCARVATKLGLGKLLRAHAGRGEESGEAAQLQTNQNVLADLTESLIGAVYLTFGYEAVRPAVVEVFDEHIRFAESSYIDHKTELQEQLARSGQSVQYKVLGYSGPPHDREFEIEAWSTARRWATASGRARSAPSRRLPPRRSTSCRRAPGARPSARACAVATHGRSRARRSRASRPPRSTSTPRPTRPRPARPAERVPQGTPREGLQVLPQGDGASLRARRRRDHRPQRQRQEQHRRRRHLGARGAEPEHHARVHDAGRHLRRQRRPARRRQRRGRAHLRQRRRGAAASRRRGERAPARGARRQLPVLHQPVELPPHRRRGAHGARRPRQGAALHHRPGQGRGVSRRQARGPPQSDRGGGRPRHVQAAPRAGGAQAPRGAAQPGARRDARTRGRLRSSRRCAGRPPPPSRCARSRRPSPRRAGGS